MNALRTAIACERSINAERAAMNAGWDAYLDREAARCGRIDEAIAQDFTESTAKALAQVAAWGLS